MRAPKRTFFNVEGIVVRARNLGEADRIVILLTPNRGLLSCVAKGARRTKSRSGGHVDLLRHISASLTGGSSDLFTISQVETLNAYLGLRADLNRLSLASHMSELCERSSLPSAANPILFELLKESLAHAEDGATGDLPKLRLWHEMRVLAISGFAPELHICTRTGAQLLAGDHWFSASDGGVVASVSHVEGSDIGNASPSEDIDTAYSSPMLPARLNVIKLLRFVADARTWDVVASLRVSGANVEDALRLTAALLMHVQDRGPGRAQRVMDEMAS